MEWGLCFFFFTHYHPQLSIYALFDGDVLFQCHRVKLDGTAVIYRPFCLAPPFETMLSPAWKWDHQLGKKLSHMLRHGGRGPHRLTHSVLILLFLISGFLTRRTDDYDSHYHHILQINLQRKLWRGEGKKKTSSMAADKRLEAAELSELWMIVGLK